MKFNRLKDIDVRGKTVLIRVDMNVPVKNGGIADDTRIRASLPSIRHCLQNGAAVIIMTHLGRPQPENPQPEDDVRPIAAHAGGLLGCHIPVIDDFRSGFSVKPGEAVMLQNVRLNAGEKQNDAALGRGYAALCDIYVNDAFGTAHRAEASTHAAALAAPVACAGILLAAELESLARALHNPARPLVAVVGGSKVSTKLTVLDKLSEKVDGLIVGGGIANTFLAAKGFPVGNSLCEKDFIAEAQRIIAKIEANGGRVPLPQDVRVAQSFDENAAAVIKDIADVAAADMILDIGPKTSDSLNALLAGAGTIVWNGPLGVFEFPAFAEGTRALTRAVAGSSAFSIAGGGDTLAAVAQFAPEGGIDYISTGGGAFLEFLEGRELPAVAALAARAV